MALNGIPVNQRKPKSELFLLLSKRGGETLPYKIKEKKMENIYTNELRKLVEQIPNTSAWKKGVKEYADELLDSLEEKAQSYERLPKN